MVIVNLFKFYENPIFTQIFLKSYFHLNLLEPQKRKCSFPRKLHEQHMQSINNNRNIEE